MPILTSVTNATNSKRKNHRLSIPIQVLINDTVYPVLNWSMGGFRVDISQSDKKLNFSIGDSVEVKMILPTGKSSIILDIEATVRNMSSNFYGMEITNINEKNKRVLRHYATLVIDGTINNIDDLAGTLFMDTIPTPIKEPILLNDIESVSVHKSFLKRYFIHLLIGIILFLLIAITFLYNYVIVQNTSGLIAGNASIYYAPYNGVIKNILVHKDEKISKNQVLFQIEDKEYKKQVKMLQQTGLMLNKQLKTYQRSLNFYKNFANKNSNKINSYIEKEKRNIQRNYLTQQKTYKRAKFLYKNQLLSFSNFSVIENQYLTYMDNYNSITQLKNSTNRNVVALEQNQMKNQDHIISTKNTILSLLREIKANKLSVQQLQKFVNNSVTLANSDGRVYKINQEVGNPIKYGDNILIVETNAKPFVFVKIASVDISNIEIGGLCVIQSNRTGQSYYGHISGIGYPAINGVYVGSNELAQSDIPVKIEFDEKIPMFYLNEYVNVYIIKNSYIGNSIAKIFIGNSH